MGKVGTGSLFVDDAKIAVGRIDRTQSIVFSADEMADFGVDLATPVVEAVGAEAKSRFTSSVDSVIIEIK